MGVVYRARHRRLNRLVALKVTRSGHLASADERKRFQAEVEAAGRLDHPNIVPVYEAGDAGGFHYFSMALVEGPSLARRVAERPLSPRDAAGLVRRVAAAVAYAHAQGVVHRDLKPGNILLDAAGQPRVTDFGLAKRTDADSSLTHAGQVMGTPNFMSPEQAEGRNDQVGPAADVYALGATLYCLLTGRPPFQAATVVDTLQQVVGKEPVAPRALNPAVPRDLDTVCLKCLQKRPDRRYASAADLGDDLQRFLDDRPIAARPVGAVEKAARWCRRNPAVAAAAGGGSAVVLAAFALVSGSYMRAEGARQNEAQQRRLAVQQGEAERWERYRASLIAAGGAMQLHNVVAARNALDAAPEEHRNWEWHYLRTQLDTARHVTRLGGPAVRVTLSPDGGLAAVDGGDGPGRLWDLTADREAAVLPVRPPGPWNVHEFSPDGKLFAYQPDPARIAVWDVAAGRERASLAVPDAGVTQYRFSPDGTRLAAGGYDGTVRVWDAATGRQVHALGERRAGRVESVAFSADGRRLVSAGLDDRAARVWDVATGEQLAVLAHEGRVFQAAFNRQGDRILTCEQYPSNALRLWDDAGRPLKVLRGHTNSAGVVAFSPDGGRIATAGLDKTLRLWDGRTGEPVAGRDGHRGSVACLAFSPDGRFVLTGSLDQTARLWDAVTGNPLGVLHGHTGGVQAARYSPDGATILTASFADGTVRRWDARTAEWNGSLRGHADFVYDVAFHPDGGRVASAAWDGTVRVWDATTGRSAPPLTYPFDGPAAVRVVSGVAFHPDGELVAACGRDGGVQFWELATGREAFRFQSPPADPSMIDPRLAFDPRGDRLAVSGGSDGTVRLWDVRRRTEAAVLAGHTGGVKAFCFGPDGTWLASAGVDRTVRVWDLGKTDPPRVLEGHTGDIHCLAVSRDGKRLASGSVDGTVRLWDAVDGREAAVLRHGANVYGVAFSPDGTRLAAACANNMIRLWDVPTGQLVAELEGHTEYVHQVAFSPDGTRLVSASGDKTVRVWDTRSAAARADPR